MTRSDTAQQVENAIRQAGGAVDVVVNNAGYSLLGSIEDMSEEEIETQFSTNVFGPVRVLKGVLPLCARRGLVPLSMLVVLLGLMVGLLVLFMPGLSLLLKVWLSS